MSNALTVNLVETTVWAAVRTVVRDNDLRSGSAATKTTKRSLLVSAGQRWWALKRRTAIDSDFDSESIRLNVWTFVWSFGCDFSPLLVALFICSFIQLIYALLTHWNQLQYLSSEATTEGTVQSVQRRSRVCALQTPDVDRPNSALKRVKWCEDSLERAVLSLLWRSPALSGTHFPRSQSNSVNASVLSARVVSVGHTIQCSTILTNAIPIRRDSLCDWLYAY